jgi:hypothetical protein
VLCGTIREEGGAGKRTFGPEKKQLSGISQQKTLPLPNRGSPVQALIEIILWLRLDEGVARKALFVQNDGTGEGGRLATPYVGDLFDSSKVVMY